VVSAIKREIYLHSSKFQPACKYPTSFDLIQTSLNFKKLAYLLLLSILERSLYLPSLVPTFLAGLLSYLHSSQTC